MTQKIPQVGDAAIMYGVACEVKEIIEVKRTRIVNRSREAYDQTMVVLDPGLEKDLILEIHLFYQIKSGEWTTKGRLLSREQKLEYRQREKDQPRDEEAALELLQA